MTGVLIAAGVVVWLLVLIFALSLARVAGRADRVLGAEAAEHAARLRALGQAVRR